MIDNYCVIASEFKFKTQLKSMNDRASFHDKCKLIDVDKFDGYQNATGYNDISIRQHLLVKEVFDKIKANNFILD